jgi:hypothetical protein
MLLGTQLWYGFFGITLASDVAFDKRIAELCRALGSPEQASRPLWSIAKEKLMVGIGTGRSPSKGEALLPSPMVPLVSVVHPPTTLAPTPTPAPAAVPPPTLAAPAPTLAAALQPHYRQYHSSIATPLVYPATPPHAHAFGSSPAPALAEPAYQPSTPHSFLQPEFGHQTELAQAREIIVKLEERQNRSFTEELSSAKLVARLESELQSKDREAVRLEAAANTVARLESELQSKDRELVRLEATTNTVARLQSELQFKKSQLKSKEMDLQSKERELVRLEATNTVARLESEMQNATLLHLVYASVVVAVGLAAIFVGRR